MQNETRRERSQALKNRRRRRVGQALAAAAAVLAAGLLAWSLAPHLGDAGGAVSTTATAALATTTSSAIVLMHMAAKHTAEALPAIITRLRAAGYELVPLTTMLGL